MKGERVFRERRKKKGEMKEVRVQAYSSSHQE